MRNQTIALLCLGLSLSLAPVCSVASDENSVHQNLEGISGLLTTPTAEVINDGTAAYSESRFRIRRILSWEDAVVRNYMVTMGYLPGVEITARFADYPELPDTMGSPNFQDRSVSVKYQLFSNPDWQVAFGGTDIGGESITNESYYGVASYSGIDKVELSLGAGTEKLEGVFGGVRYAPSDWVSLMGEYDTEGVNYGVALQPLKGLTLTGGVVNEEGAVGASYAFPLDPRGQQTLCCPVPIKRCEIELSAPCDIAAHVRDALVAEGFENVVVGSNGSVLFVECESRRYREQIDALGVAALLAVQSSPASTERIVISPKIDDIPQLTVQFSVADYITFLTDPGECLECGLTVGPHYPGSYPADTVFATEGNKKPGHGQVELRLTNSVEIARQGKGSWDGSYGLGLKEDLFIGRGLRLEARQEFPITNDLGNEKTAVMNRQAALKYHDNWSPELYVAASAGWYRGERYGGVAEAGYYFDAGRYKLGGRYGYFRDEGTSSNDPEDGLYLGELAYYTPELDWELAALAGQFQEDDQGVRMESTRYFGPTELSFFAYDTDQSAAHGGFMFFVPLPWFDDGQPVDDWNAVLSPDFGYLYRTDSDALGQVTLGSADLDHVRQRLRPEYVSANAAALRRAAWLFLSR